MNIKKIKRITRSIAKYKIVIIISSFLTILFMLCRGPQSFEVFIKDTNVYFKLERFGTYARLYISHSDKFGEDYVEFSHTAIMFPEFYYVDLDTLYFVDTDDWYCRSIKSNQFVIKKINLLNPPEIIVGVTTVDEYEKGESASRETQRVLTSIQERSTNSIRISDYASGITVYNSNNEVVARDVDPLVLAGH